MARQGFTAEFKREAVRLLEQGDKPVTQLSVELGVPRNRLSSGAMRCGRRESTRSRARTAARCSSWS